ncbi:MAG: rhomboid family intramembrane serine protease [Chloroflexia bacterium]|nr:rhomboid family intramembrane serine protease [Chloroflexia bacterium]
MKNWEEQIELPNKASDIDYAYILISDDKPVICTQEEMLKVIENNEDVKFVTTPQNDRFIVLGSDFETLQPLLKKKKDSIKSNLYVGLVISVLWIGLMLLFSLTSDNGFWSDTTGKLNLLVFGVIPVLNSIYELISIRRINESNYIKESSEIKFNFWINQKKIISIFIVTGVLVLITLLQFITGLKDSVELAGLVKPKTLEGQYWRLLTCTLLHGSVMHILFNGIAIFIIGRMVIRITGFSYFSVVFLFSGLLGSIFSLYFMPKETSVGASGGIMGLIGFILILGLKFKDNIPRNIIKSMVNTIILVTIIGISASEMIDNAAHGGGLIGGILIGLLLIRKRENMIPYRPTLLINILGIASTLILIAGIGMIVKQL